jgi:hypothetical protein
MIVFHGTKTLKKCYYVTWCSSGCSNFKLVKPIGVVLRSFSVTGTAGQGDLNKDAELARWSQNTPQVPYNKHLMISQFKHLCHQDVIL